MVKCNRDLFLNSNKNNKKVIHFSIFLFLNVTIPTCCSHPYSAHRDSPMSKHATPTSSGASDHWDAYANVMRYWINPNCTENFPLMLWQSWCSCTSHLRSAWSGAAVPLSQIRCLMEILLPVPQDPDQQLQFEEGFFCLFLFSEGRCLGANRIKNWFWCVIYGRSCSFHKLNLNHSSLCFPHNVDAMGLEMSTDLH